MAETSIAFLPYIKRQPPLPIDKSHPGQLTAELELTIVDSTGASHSADVRPLTLRGPGDIVGMSGKMIARTEPPSGTTDFEPNYFCFVEFVDPDLPWRYSLDAVDLSSGETPPKRLTPWLTLILLSHAEIGEMEQEGIEVLAALDDRRRLLSVQGKYLPNLDHAWATAHVQLSRPTGSIEAFIDNHPARHCSRLFCFRKLEPETSYVAFLVPSYRIGVQAALGIGADGAGDERAWHDPDAQEVVMLPIYYDWSFATSESGDFESLARALTPAAVDPAQVGTRPVDANRMTPLQGPEADRFFLREGALAAPGFSEVRQPYSEASERLPLTKPLLTFLNRGLESELPPTEETGSDDGDDQIP